MKKKSPIIHASVTSRQQQRSSMKSADLVDSSPIIQAIIDRAGECPSAPIPVIPERYALFALPRDQARDVFVSGLEILGIVGCVLIAAWLAS